MFNQPFVFNFTSYKYAKETSSSVTLAIRPANSSSTDLLILAENLKASSSVGGSWANYLQDAVYPQFFYGDSDGAKKSYDLVIVETYNSYGVSGIRFVVVALLITFIQGGKAISSKEKITVTFEQK